MEANSQRLEPGDLVTVMSGAGWGKAYRLLERPNRVVATQLRNGVVALLLGRDLDLSVHRMQPMMRIVVEGELLHIDERFLFPCESSGGVV